MSDTTYNVGKSFITFLFVGKTGDGKSSTSNTILGQRKFKSSASFNSTTKKCQREIARIQGHNVVLVDSPGLADTDITTDGGLEQLKQEVINILATEPDGFDVTFIVIKYGRTITAEDRQVFEQLHLLFGQEYVRKRGILVVTHKDQYDPEENDDLPIHEFMAGQKGLFSKMLAHCNNRVVYFDNDTKDESVRQEQVKQLLDMAAKVKQTPLDATPEIVLKAKETLEEAIKKSKKPVIDKDTLTGLWLIIYQLEKTAPDSRNIEKFEAIIQKLKEHHMQLIEQDKGTDRLKDVIANVSSLKETIKLRIAAIEENRHIKEAAEKMSEDIETLKMCLEESDEAKSILLMTHLVHALAHFLSGLGATVREKKEDPNSESSCALQ